MTTVTFEVCDVTRPIFSAETLADNGCEITYGKDGNTFKHVSGVLIPLVKRASRLSSLEVLEVKGPKQTRVAWVAPVGDAPMAAVAAAAPARVVAPASYGWARPVAAAMRMEVDYGERAHAVGPDLVPAGPAQLPETSLAQPADDIGIAPRGIKGPLAPTAEERATHELTHQPAAPWCEACILGRGRDEVHRSINEPVRAAEIPFDPV